MKLQDSAGTATNPANLETFTFNTAVDGEDAHREIKVQFVGVVSIGFFAFLGSF